MTLRDVGCVLAKSLTNQVNISYDVAKLGTFQKLIRYCL